MASLTSWQFTPLALTTQTMCLCALWSLSLLTSTRLLVNVGTLAVSGCVCVVSVMCAGVGTLAVDGCGCVVSVMCGLCAGVFAGQLPTTVWEYSAPFFLPCCLFISSNGELLNVIIIANCALLSLGDSVCSLDHHTSHVTPTHSDALPTHHESHPRAIANSRTNTVY